MKEFFEKMLSVTMTAILILVIILMVADIGCDLRDPSNSMNAIHVDEIKSHWSERFTEIYTSRDGDTKIEVYKDNEHRGCELIIVIEYAVTGRSISIEYVTHVVRDRNLRIKP